MEREEENSPAMSFTVLPEWSMSDILSLTSPRDACRAASISWGFKSLADSDAVWERFLPSDYQSIVSRVVAPLHFSTKKELYFRLCNSPILLDGGKMSINLNKLSGKKCYMLGARELSIAWKDTLVYWRWRSLPESRFSEVAELLAVCWLEIKGKIGIQILSPKTTYVVYLVFNIAASSHGLDLPVKTLVRLVRGGEDATDEETNTVFLRPPKNTCAPRWQNSGFNNTDQTGKLPRKREDGWIEIEMGEFVYDNEDYSEVEMSFMETKRLNWKSGLIVEGIEIRPKEEVIFATRGICTRC